MMGSVRAGIYIPATNIFVVCCMMYMYGGFMLKEKYTEYKKTYKKYILLIKSGNFYLALNDDAIVLSNIFKFKILESSNFIKCGFPLISLCKIEKRLEELEVNYLIIDNDIINKEKYKNNNYDKYLVKSNYDILLNRINKINSILKNNLNNKKISNTLNKIEDIVCKISY